MNDTKPNDGGPFFPLPKDIQPGLTQGVFGILYDHMGVSLRDYFAGQALSGMQTQWKHIELYLTSHGSGTAKDVREFMAWASYEQADAMIAARNS